jgi:methionine synthase II (cobalamin-independent)
MSDTYALPKSAHRNRPQRALGYMAAARQALQSAIVDVPNPSEIHTHITDLIEQCYEVEDEIRAEAIE